jgi:hypothetical protein
MKILMLLKEDSKKVNHGLQGEHGEKHRIKINPRLQPRGLETLVNCFGLKPVY